MPAFSTTSAALTWSPSGQCHGVVLKGTVERCRVVAAWKSGPESGETLSGKLITGSAELRAGNTDQVVAGASTPTGGFMDISVPQLRAEEQAKALRYELVKYSPLPVEKIAWGYRVVQRLGSNQEHVRLVYLPQTEWENWLEIVPGIVSGIDTLISPIGALDPVLTDYDVYIPSDDGGVWLRDTGSGHRDCGAEPRAEAGQFGHPEAPLDVPGLDAATLADRSKSEQLEFIPSLLLGMYGLTKNIEKDKTTLMRVPETLRPRRNRVVQTVAMVLALYILGFGGFHAAQYGVAAYQHYQALQEHNTELENKIGSIESPEEKMEQVASLQQELEENTVERPTLTASLLSLTSRTDEDVWIQNFSWDDGEMRVEAVTEKDNVKLTEKWGESAVLTDVVPRRRQVKEGRMTISLRLFAGY